MNMYKSYRILLRKEAIKYVQWMLKKNVNPFNAFMGFFNLTPEDIKIEGGKKDE